MRTTAMIHVRVAEDLKEQSAKTLAAMAGEIARNHRARFETGKEGIDSLEEAGRKQAGSFTPGRNGQVVFSFIRNVPGFTVK